MPRSCPLGQADDAAFCLVTTGLCEYHKAAAMSKKKPSSTPPEVVEDFISGKTLKATPEEIEAVQIFAEKLVKDYGYPKEHIQTRPQFRIRRSPSDEEKTYPVDIAVFSNDKRIEENLFLIVECKRKQRKDGIQQLKIYMDLSPAELGVWFNGEDHCYLWKVHRKKGKCEYLELPNIPRFGQRVEDVGLYKRQDLKKPSNLKAVFRDLRNHLAGMTTGITRDETLAKEVINLLFCKILDEQETPPNETVRFRAGTGEPPEKVFERIAELFEKVKTKAFGDVFDEHDSLNIDPKSLTYVVGELQNYCIMEADRDAIGDAFEVFIGPALRGSEGQFFTPRNVVKMVVDILDPKPGETIIDPACGSGGFLITTLESVWGKLRKEAAKFNWTERHLAKREVDIATDCFRGIDKDAFLATVCKAYMALVGDGRGGIFCENGLLPPSDWQPIMQAKIKLGSFDLVMTNPPFGTKIPIKGANILSQFDLAYRWRRDKSKGTVERTNELPEEAAPQIVFLERCLQLLKPGGRMGIVLPESILGNPTYDYITQYLLNETRLLGVVTMPEPLFKTSGKGGTHTKVSVLFIQKAKPKEKYSIFMADVKWCGHDSRGNPTRRRNAKGEYVLLDEVPDVAQRFKSIKTSDRMAGDHLGFRLNSTDIRNNILVPKYYDPEIDKTLADLQSTHELVSLAELAKSKVISLDTGIEVGKMAYGTGTIPFIRTSDLSNWEIKADFKHGVSKEIYEQYKQFCDVDAGDILIVRDGTYLIGTMAIVTKSDLPMLFQSHIYRVRVHEPAKLNPWLFFACLHAPIVKKQIRAKQFTQDIIDTVGKRIYEVIVPFPKDKEYCAKVAKDTRRIIETRLRLRDEAKQLALAVQGIESPSEVEEEDLIEP